MYTGVGCGIGQSKGMSSEQALKDTDCKFLLPWRFYGRKKSPGKFNPPGETLHCVRRRNILTTTPPWPHMVFSFLVWPLKASVNSAEITMVMSEL